MSPRNWFSQVPYASPACAVDRRCKSNIDTFLFTFFEISLQIARVFFQILRTVELDGVDENRYHHESGLLAGFSYQFVVSGTGGDFEACAGIGLITAFLFVALMEARGLYQPQSLLSVRRQIQGVIVGWLVGRLLLAVNFYCVLSPLGILLRLLGRDPLGRRLDPSCQSYWTAKPAPAGIRSYFRQS